MARRRKKDDRRGHYAEILARLSVQHQREEHQRELDIMRMRGLVFGSACSGISAASAAWGPLGWRAAWYSEIERFPSEVLGYHYPQVPNLGDITRITGDMLDARGRIDLLVGGDPLPIVLSRRTQKRLG